MSRSAARTRFTCPVLPREQGSHVPFCRENKIHMSRLAPNITCDVCRSGHTSHVSLSRDNGTCDVWQDPDNKLLAHVFQITCGKILLSGSCHTSHVPFGRGNGTCDVWPRRHTSHVMFERQRSVGLGETG